MQAQSISSWTISSFFYAIGQLTDSREKIWTIAITSFTTLGMMGWYCCTRLRRANVRHQNPPAPVQPIHARVHQAGPANIHRQNPPRLDRKHLEPRFVAQTHQVGPAKTEHPSDICVKRRKPKVVITQPLALPQQTVMETLRKGLAEIEERQMAQFQYCLYRLDLCHRKLIEQNIEVIKALITKLKSIKPEPTPSPSPALVQQKQAVIAELNNLIHQ